MQLIVARQKFCITIPPPMVVGSHPCAMSPYKSSGQVPHWLCPLHRYHESAEAHVHGEALIEIPLGVMYITL